MRFIKEPFEFLVIDNFLDNNQKINIWKEIDFYIDNGLVIPSTMYQDGSGFDENNNSKANRHSLFLANALINYRVNSKIYQAIRSNFLHTNVSARFPQSTLLKYLPITNYDSTLLSFYQNGDYYKSHFDYGIISCILYLIPNNEYSGGDIVFTDFNVTHKPLDNQMIVFPSCLNHEVTKIQTFDSNDKDYKRLSITTFLSIEQSIVAEERFNHLNKVKVI